MKSRQKYWLCGIFILSLLIIAVFAQDEKQVAGITPDSIFYSLDVFFDDLRTFLTPSPLGKATVILSTMEERMAEMEEMAKENKTREAKRAELEGRKQMQKFESSIENIKKKDAPELKEHIQTHAERLEIWKQRLMDYGLDDYADAMAEAIVLLETTENVIVNIPEDLSPESTFIISSICKEAGAKTVEECNELISSGALTAQIRIVPEGRVDPHNCSGWGSYSDGKTKWCCDDSDGTYSPEWIEMRKSEGMGGILDYYYRKGTVEYKIINLKTGEIEEGIETDSCDGNTLTEWFCPRVINMVTRNERYSETYECSYRCEDGACIACNLDSICDEIEGCSCPDCEGKNNGCDAYYICQDGECVLGEVPGGIVPEEFEGECTDSDGGQDYFVKGTTTGKSPDIINFTQTYIDACMDDVRLREGYCGDNEEIQIVAYSCPNGCQDGACIA